GLPDAQTPIQAWRAVQFLEETPHIRPGTFDAAWYAAGRSIDPSHAPLLDMLAEDIGVNRFGALQEKILNRTPSNEEMRRMFVQFNLAGVRVDFREWEQEIIAGRMGFDSEVQGYYQYNEDFIRRCEERERSYHESKTLASY